MEPVTHVLTGACLARAGFNRRAAYATITLMVAAEMPDVDTVWSWLGPIEGFAHHRGITHTFLGLPFEAAILVGAVYGLHRWRMLHAEKAEQSSNPVPKPLNIAPVRWGVLYGCAIVGLLSHLLLDYTNNYGLRPFYPFNTHWYAASIAFIFDPVIFALLVTALVLPSIFELVNIEVGAKNTPFRGRGLAVAALLCIVAWWGLRYIERDAAVQLASQQTYELQQQPIDVSAPQSVVVAAPAESDEDGTTSVGQTGGAGGNASTAKTSPPPQDTTELVQPPSRTLQPQEVEASPEPLNPFKWAVAIDYGPLYQLANVDVLANTVTPSEVTYPKIASDAAVSSVEGSPLGRAYLDWSAMPILTEDQPAVSSSGRVTHRVVLRDPRFMGDVAWLRLSGTTPLTAAVTVDDAGHVIRQTMDGRREPAGRGAVYEAHWSLADDKPANHVAQTAAASVRHTAVLPKFDTATTDAAAHRATSSKPEPVPSSIQPSVAKIQPLKAAPVVPPVPVPAAKPIPVAKPESAKNEAAVEVPKPVPAKASLSKRPADKPEPTKVAAAGLPAARPEPSDTGAVSGIKSKVQKFKNWLHWLANGN